MSDFSVPKVKIINPVGSGWRGTQCFINGTEINRVISADFHVAVNELPTSVFELMALPDIEMESEVKFSYTPQSVEDAVRIMRHELLTHGEVYNGFKASLKTAIEKYCTCGLPFEPEEETAGKILDFMIGEEQKE
jgi:hypothetical protein